MKYMNFHKLKTVVPSSYPPLCFGDNVLEGVFHGDCLGVSLDLTLRLNRQVQTVSKKNQDLYKYSMKLEGF